MNQYILDFEQEQVSIEQYLQYAHPQFEYAVSSMMSKGALKQVVLFERDTRFKNYPEIAKARELISAHYNALLEAVWNNHPQQGDWHYAEAEGMWVKCEVNSTGERTIFVASHPHPQALVGFSYTLKGE
ncbi:MAG: hypothetical protein KJ043_18970 [Anaerolineae bacterium]|nr:hypothetical protein [Anaerolineae bacterium]